MRDKILRGLLNIPLVPLNLIIIIFEAIKKLSKLIVTGCEGIITKYADVLKRKAPKLTARSTLYFKQKRREEREAQMKRSFPEWYNEDVHAQSSEPKEAEG